MIREDLDELKPITEEILYCILHSDTKMKTGKICEKFHYQDSLIRSRLDNLRERGMVAVKKHQEHGGSARATNYYRSTSKAAEYERQHGLEIPKYVYKKTAGKVDEMMERVEELEEWKECDKEWKDAAENRIKALEQRADELESD